MEKVIEKSKNQKNLKDYNERLEVYGDKLKNLYNELYGNYDNSEMYYENLLKIMENSFKSRKRSLRTLDKVREEDSKWFLNQDKIGYVMYLDLFCEDLKGLKSKIDYLKELNITYLHIMPIFKMPKEQNDGGYAVSDYNQIDDRFGTMDQFEKILDMFRKERISVCLDFVMNHTSNEHDWALKAINGEKEYQDMYFIYDDKDTPNKFEEHMLDVFPKASPGNFTYEENMKKYVLTSFYNYQWDLNYKNPFVFNMIAENILQLANRGVEIFRLDSVPFIWKEIGTTCRNLPQINIIVQMYKLITKIVCPAVILKGEDIVNTYESLSYFDDKESKGFSTMYNASMMALLWNSLATRDVRMMVESLKRNSKLPEDATWINYIRCNDNMDCILDEDVIKHFGFNPYEHKQFIINFYKGDFQGSFSKGKLYELDESKMDARISGRLASLCGLEKAMQDENLNEVYLSQRRIILLNSIILAYSGIPILYSGDEIGQLNDYWYISNPSKKHDNRWVHRSLFNWNIAQNRNDIRTVEGNIFNSIKRCTKIRNSHEIFRSDILSNPIYTNNDSVFTFYKRSNNEDLLVVSNFSEHYQTISLNEINNAGFKGDFTELIEGYDINLDKEELILRPYDFKWLYKKYNN